MGIERQSRIARRDEPYPLRVQGRDLFILEALGKMRFLTTSQLAGLAFEDRRSAAQKRLRKLLDSGAVRVWLRSLNEENLYSLDQRGAKLLGEDALAPRRLDGMVDHLLAINQVRIACAIALHRSGAELVHWRSDWELREYSKSRLVPDAVFGIRWADGGLQNFMLEVDRRTRSTRGFLKKVLGYTAWRASESLVIFIGHESRWVERYRRTLARTRLSPRVWFTTFEQLQAEGPLAPIFALAGEDYRYSLLDLSRLPYGKEMSNQKLPDGRPVY